MTASSAKDQALQKDCPDCDGGLTRFLMSIAGDLSEPVKEVIGKMKADDIALDDLMHMERKDLYHYGVGFKSAKVILEKIKGYQCKEEQPGPLVLKEDSKPQGYPSMKRKLMDIPPSIQDILKTHLDPKSDGVSSWPQFGEMVLGLKSVIELRQFQTCESPTVAIINKKIATEPDATLGDVFIALEAIGRKDIVQLVSKELEVTATLEIQVLSNSTRHLKQAFSWPLERPPLYRESSIDHGDGDVGHPLASTASKDERVHPRAKSMDNPGYQSTWTDMGTDRQTASTCTNDSPSSNQPQDCTESTLVASSHMPAVQTRLQLKQQQECEEPLKDHEVLCSFLKSMSLEPHQEIDVTCRVYNATTGVLVEGNASPALLRDIKLVPRVQEFLPKSIPLGAEIRLEITTGSPCYIYIFNIGTSGKTVMLFPNSLDSNNYYNANQPCYLPSKEYGFQIQGKPGKEIIQVMAFSHPPDVFNHYLGTDIQKSDLVRDITFARRNKYGFAQVEFTVG